MTCRIKVCEIMTKVPEVEKGEGNSPLYQSNPQSLTPYVHVGWETLHKVMRPRDTNTWKAKVFCIEAREKYASAQRSCGFSCKLRPH